MEAAEFPGEVAERCLRMTHQLDLLLSGIDLRLTPQGEWYCFEVNTSPAFSWFEDQTGQPIARAVANLLLEGVP
jgi:D-alanine-D-alanine ligase-like ATP-grasp enzyme